MLVITPVGLPPTCEPLQAEEQKPSSPPVLQVESLIPRKAGPMVSEWPISWSVTVTSSSQ